MSRIVVACYPGAEGIDFDLLIETARPSFFDVLESHREPGLFVGVASYWTEPEDEAAPSLVADDQRGLLLAWDGRIDARCELARELGASPTISSAALALRAFQRWGKHSPERLSGDFAFVVVERASGRIFAARDAFGLRPLAHARHRGGRALASDEKLLFGLGVDRSPDVEALGRFIARVYVPTYDTLYRDVRSVLPGGTLEVSEGRDYERRYFEPNVDEQPFSDSDHVDRVRAALTAAVADRSRGSRLIASEASGGVDSSTVVALLAERLRQAGREPPLLLNLRCTGMTCDESRFARSLARHVGASLFEAEGADARFGPEGAAEVDLPDVISGPGHVLRQEAHRRGARVCFTGQGSDELQFRDMLVDDTLATGAWLDAARFAGLFDHPFSRGPWEAVLRTSVRLLAPARWRRERRDRQLAAQLSSWLAPKGREIALAGTLALDHFPERYRHASPLRRASYAELIFSANITLFAQADSAFGRAHGLELAVPYCDQRVVEAFAGLPTRMRASFELPKPTLREIARDLLPPALAWKYPGVDYAPFLHGAWQRASREWSALATTERLAELGLVDGAEVRKAVEKGFAEGRLAWELHPVLRAEAWLRRAGATK